MSAHTKGPWHVLPEEFDKNYLRIRGTVLGGRFKIANVISPEYEDSRMREWQETQANAHLISAAPELLAELKRLLAAYRTAVKLGYSEGDAYTTGPHNAIAKAEGGVL